MTRIVLLFCTLSAVLLPQLLRAQATTPESTGVELLEECQAAERDTPSVKAAHCLGYLNGMADGLDAWESYNKYHNGNLPPAACIPRGATMRELAIVVVKYLNDHPNRLHESYRLLAILALADGYPCKK